VAVPAAGYRLQGPHGAGHDAHRPDPGPAHGNPGPRPGGSGGIRQPFHRRGLFPPGPHAGGAHGSGAGSHAPARDHYRPVAGAGGHLPALLRSGPGHGSPGRGRPGGLGGHAGLKGGRREPGPPGSPELRG